MNTTKTFATETECMTAALEALSAAYLEVSCNGKVYSVWEPKTRGCSLVIRFDCTVGDRYVAGVDAGRGKCSGKFKTQIRELVGSV